MLDYKTIQGLLDELNKQTKAEMERVLSDDGDVEFESFHDGFSLAVSSIKELFSKENIVRLENKIEEQTRKLKEEIKNEG